jgi:DNA-binding LytR/AlgR family response regulator
MKINCLIVDDEQYARKLLEGYVDKHPDLELGGLCKNSMEAMQQLNQQQIDLMFLDIQMPDLTGIDFLKTLTHKPLVIFTTAYQEYALDGYELDVIDYMLKPISFERFLKGINKALEHLRMKTHGPGTTVTGPQPDEGPADYINIKADYKVYRMKHDAILFIEGLKEYVTFYSSERKYIVLESLKRLETVLPSKTFLRVHKSYIVNVSKVEALYGNMIEIGKHQIPIGKSYAEQVKSRLFKL